MVNNCRELLLQPTIITNDTFSSYQHRANSVCWPCADTVCQSVLVSDTFLFEAV